MCWGLGSGRGMWPGLLPPTTLPSAKASTHADSLPSSAVQGPPCSSTTSLHESTHLPLEEGPRCRVETGSQGGPKTQDLCLHPTLESLFKIERSFPLLAYDPLLPSRILMCLLELQASCAVLHAGLPDVIGTSFRCSLGPGNRARQSLSPSCLLQQYLAPAETLSPPLQLHTQ